MMGGSGTGIATPLASQLTAGGLTIYSCSFNVVSPKYFTQENFGLLQVRPS